MTNRISGGCLCGEIKFTVEDKFSNFYFCYCEQCRKLTGSTHASNLFTNPENISWEQGEGSTVRFDHPSRTFSQVFCAKCGSGLPYISQSGQSLVVPAGSLDRDPSKQPDAQIFCAEQTDWQKTGINARKFPGFPE